VYVLGSKAGHWFHSVLYPVSESGLMLGAYRCNSSLTLLIRKDTSILELSPSTLDEDPCPFLLPEYLVERLLPKWQIECLLEQGIIDPFLQRLPFSFNHRLLLAVEMTHS
jgi:hypothetical protein